MRFIAIAILTLLHFSPLHSQQKPVIEGTWGMFKDRHPDGWGKHNPPYLYLDFQEDGQYTRTFLHKKRNTIVVGKYTVTEDSLIIFTENIVTNGKEKASLPADTSLIYDFKADVLEIREDWKRILGKKTIRWRHKKYFRPAMPDEKSRLEQINTNIRKAYENIN